MEFKNPQEPFLIRRLDNISYKPILSVSNFTSLDIECVIAGSSDRKLRFLDVDYLTEIAAATMDKKNVSFVAISDMSPNGDDPVIVTGGKDSIIQVWDPTPDSINRTSITLPTTEVRSLAVYQGSKALAVIGTKDGKVFVWDLRENVEVVKFAGHTASVHCVCIANTAPDAENPADDLARLCVASGGADRVVRTWDILTGKRVNKFRHVRSISSLVVSNRGIRPLLATAGVERMIKLWDLQTGILLRTLTGHLDQINCLSLFDSYEMLLISGSSDRTIRVYDMLSGECICCLVGHRDAVLSATVTGLETPRIVSSSEDLSLIQWDLQEIIDRFYYKEGELSGTRNKVPPHLPAIDYEAPEELDRKALSKEERKRIRKERKKQQRMKNLLNDWNGGFKTEGKADQQDDDDNDYDQDDNEPFERQQQQQQQQQQWTQKDTPEEPVIEREEEEKLPSPSQHLHHQSEDFDDLDGDHIPGFEDMDDQFGDDDQYEYYEGGEKEEELQLTETTAEAETKKEEAKTANIVKRSTQIVVGNIFGNALTKVLPVSEETASLSENNNNDSNTQQGSTSKQPSAANSRKNSRKNSETGSTIIKQSSTSSLVKSMLGKLGLGATVAVEIPGEAEQTEDKTQKENEVPAKRVGPPNGARRTIARRPDPKNSTAGVADTASATAGTNGTLRSSISGPPADDNFKAMAQQTQTKYNIAVVEHQLASDRQKKKAAANLQARLNSRKNKGKEENTAEEGENNTELIELKAEKLKQHKLQESRRRESMAVAKQRSANALQKRLEELAQKRASVHSSNQGNQITTINEGEADSDGSV